MPSNSAIRIGLSILSIVVFLLLSWYFRTIVVYVLSAAVISIILRPIIKRLNKIKIAKRHLPSSLTAALTLIIFFSIISAFAALLVPVIAEEVREISSLDYRKIGDSLEQPIQKTESFLKKYYLMEADRSLEKTFVDYINEFIMAIEFANIANSILSTLGNSLLGIVSIIFITFFFLKEPPLFKNILYTLTPSGYETQMKDILNKSKELLTRYFIGIIIQVSTVSILITTGLTIIGFGNADIPFKLAVMIGIFAGFFNIIPYVGPIIGGFFGIVICISSNLELPFYTEMAPMIYKVGIVFLVVQMVDNFVLQPFIFSTSVKAHPLEIFILILASASIAGVAGMIIAIPTYTVLRIVASQFLGRFKIVRNLTANI
ncbi:MAG: AI-2E family transporter [Chitinophagales bacterium]|nr:AI-2E family transporter [Chitinophagales bacterium]